MDDNKPKGQKELEDKQLRDTYTKIIITIVIKL